MLRQLSREVQRRSSVLGFGDVIHRGSFVDADSGNVKLFGHCAQSFDVLQHDCLKCGPARAFALGQVSQK